MFFCCLSFYYDAKGTDGFINGMFVSTEPIEAYTGSYTGWSEAGALEGSEAGALEESEAGALEEPIQTNDSPSKQPDTDTLPTIDEEEEDATERRRRLALRLKHLLTQQ